MTYWPAWLGGLSLALVMVLHWFGVGRMMAVSGRITAIVDRLRHGPAEPASPAMTEAELILALRAATEAQFGAEAVPDAPSGAEPETSTPVSAPFARRRPQPFGTHLLLFVFLGLGGLLATHSGWSASATLRGEAFSRLFGGSPWVAVPVLLLGGMLVGFGTRMAGGCTSGHGLCGTSRFERGSLLATCSFFAAGVVTSFVLGRLL